MRRIPGWAWIASVVVVAAAGFWLFRVVSRRNEVRRREAAVGLVLSDSSSAAVRTACTTCHVFPPPDMLPRDYWPVAIRGMFQIANRRGIRIPISVDHAMAWYLLQAPVQLPPAPGRTDAGPGPLTWDLQPWRPDSVAAGQEPAVTHVQMARLLGGRALDVLVSDVSTDRIWALRPYAPEKPALVIGSAPNPARLAVTDLDHDGRIDVVVAALGELKPTNDPVGSVIWFRRTGPEAFEPTVIADSLGRVADVRATDLTNNGRTDLLVAVFGWMSDGELLWFENTSRDARHPAFERHVIDARSGFTDVRAVDLNGDGRKDVVALIAQEFQQVMVYWAEPDGFRPEVLFQAPNPDWGYTGMEVADVTGDGRPDIIAVNGDNLDLTTPKPFHGVGMLENQGDGHFVYRPITAMYGAHRAVPIDLTGDGRIGLVVAAYLPPSVSSKAPPPSEALIWLERVGPTQFVRRVLKSDGVDHMTMDAGDATGDGLPDIALGSMDLGVVDPAQAHRGPPLTSWVTLWKNLGKTGPAGPAARDTIDWTASGG